MPVPRASVRECPPELGRALQAPHPDWTPGEPWPQEVSSYAIDDGARLLLFFQLEGCSTPATVLDIKALRRVKPSCALRNGSFPWSAHS
jgi:hypothetical protein